MPSTRKSPRHVFFHYVGQRQAFRESQNRRRRKEAAAVRGRLNNLRTYPQDDPANPVDNDYIDIHLTYPKELSRQNQQTEKATIRCNQRSEFQAIRKRWQQALKEIRNIEVNPDHYSWQKEQGGMTPLLLGQHTLIGDVLRNGDTVLLEWNEMEGDMEGDDIKWGDKEWAETA
ncbi:uncharacterized protein PV07_12854 [Cladophialophora immunda]|uniref:Uncharacterized protein n=1 Tax=Cladophialophora immunda TaxID=569365 RepID=A0A0D2BRK8_9EURO|nr:uncharacterized protein PV07_12854 [Cladophialophora immunda]KIW21713.1 hypothetical protein PV07_12854 [Cladophialophora immunda]